MMSIMSMSMMAPLSVGDSVSVQNREGNKPLRWDRTGQVVERLENKQYLIKHDGSGMVLLRTRGHMKKIKPRCIIIIIISYVWFQ